MPPALEPVPEPPAPEPAEPLAADHPRRPAESVAKLLDLRIPEIPEAAETPGFAFFPQSEAADDDPAATGERPVPATAPTQLPPPAPPQEQDPPESAREHAAVAPATEAGSPPRNQDSDRPRRKGTTAQPPRGKPRGRTGGRRRAPERRTLPRIAAVMAVVIAIAAGAVAAFLISQDSDRGAPTGEPIPANSPTASAPARDADVADFTGFRGVRFGDKLTALQDAKRVVDVTTSPCGRRYYVAGAEGLVTLEFRAEGLTVLRLKKPVVHTPEGIAIGDPMAVVSQTYPDTTELPRSGAAATQAPGLLVERDQDRAYLFVGTDAVTDIIIGDSSVVTGLYRAGATGC